ncbi:hypothetical protein MLD38_039805 [Melastoma candidum]|uniref:Uncharacterized protein n=1 Tax=Melastoma candidum TaxID=119954 RepID=A0ACB9L4F7_9MYRT|nr:hypothetical protein MLD38_039805 [Melastoma candidum]
MSSSFLTGRSYFLQLFILLQCLVLTIKNSANASGDDNMIPLLPDMSPTSSPQPLLPFLAPSPLSPFSNSSKPKLSGLCTLNFSDANKLMTTTSTDCWAVFAPFLAHVICCPQLEATVNILIGQSSKVTNLLALNETLSKHCLSDIEQVLASQGAADNVNQMCSIRPSNLSAASCPVKDVYEFESTVDYNSLLDACGKIDPVKECCEQTCQNAISEASMKLTLRSSNVFRLSEQRMLMDGSASKDDCKSIVLRYLASRIGPSRAKENLRILSNCNINKFCPLVFPEMKDVATSCSRGVKNQTECCSAMNSYVSHLQKQSFTTNLQAVDCASSMGMKLLKLNITKDLYSLCRITLQDFSVQVGNEGSGCLLPSLPSDATFDHFSGISFLCDLNDRIPAPWPTASQLQTSVCNKTVKIPALPAAASSQSGPSVRVPQFLVHPTLVVILMMLL